MNTFENILTSLKSLLSLRSSFLYVANRRNLVGDEAKLVKIYVKNNFKFKRDLLPYTNLSAKEKERDAHD